MDNFCILSQVQNVCFVLLKRQAIDKFTFHCWIKETWYCHAFSSEKLFVVLKGKWFEISLKRDETWDEMIEYGVVHANVERRYLETIPLHI